MPLRNLQLLFTRIQNNTMSIPVFRNRRPSLRRLVQALAGLLFVIILLLGMYSHHLHIHLRAIRWYKYNDSQIKSETGWADQRKPFFNCVSPLDPHAIVELRRLLLLALRVLAVHGVRAALCHGALWGVLRRGDLLPWDPAPDLCLLTEELQRAENGGGSEGENPSLRALRDAHFLVSDFDHWMGLYNLTYVSKDLQRLRINLRVFSDCTKFYYWTHTSEYGNSYPKSKIERARWACSHGWSFYAFHWASDGYQGFPKFLLEPPFNTIAFGGSRVAVPNDDYEIQKYVYPNDWWVDKTPALCHKRHQ